MRHPPSSSKAASRAARLVVTRAMFAILIGGMSILLLLYTTGAHTLRLGHVTLDLGSMDPRCLGGRRDGLGGVEDDADSAALQRQEGPAAAAPAGHTTCAILHENGTAYVLAHQHNSSSPKHSPASSSCCAEARLCLGDELLVVLASQGIGSEHAQTAHPSPTLLPQPPTHPLTLRCAVLC